MDYDLHRVFISLFPNNKYMLFLNYLRKMGFEPRKSFINRNKNKKKNVISLDDLYKIVSIIDNISDIDSRFTTAGYRSLQKQKENVIAMIDKIKKFEHQNGH